MASPMCCSEELIKNARAIATPGKGILAADESTGTIGKRFASIGVENVLPNRMAYRELLFRTDGLEQYISGVILFEEALYGAAADGTPLPALLAAKGILPGIKVDKGVKPLYGGAHEGETVTQGLDDLDVRCAKAYAAGARFAKWRAVFRLQDGADGTALPPGAHCGPSPLAIHENADALARYAAVCQANRLVPVVEPEVLMDGAHGLEAAAAATEAVLAAVYGRLAAHGVVLEGTLLKPNLAVPGAGCLAGGLDPAQVARHTVRCLQRTLPCAVPGVCFLSGGLSEEDATACLNAVNAKEGGAALGPRPWYLSFSFGRALQHSCLRAWKGDAANTAAAQAELLKRCRANSEATLGMFTGPH